MRSEAVLGEVQQKLQEMKGLRAIRMLNGAARDEVIAKEREAERLAKENGLMEVHNEGFWATMGRGYQVALVLDCDTDLITRTECLLQLRDQEGQMLGEWVNEDKACELRGRRDVRFMSRDFVLYSGLEMKGEPHFVLPAVDFPFLEGVEGIRNVTSCSPSGLADECIRSWMGFGDEGYLSHIVGFDLDGDRPSQ